MNRRIWITALLLGGLGLVAAPAPVAAQEFLGHGWQKWDKDLNSTNAKVRRGGAFALGKIGPKAGPALAHLVAVLRQDKDVKVQEAAACALGEICINPGGAAPTPEVIASLCEALTSNADASVKRSAAMALGYIGRETPAVLAALNGQADNKNPAVRQNVAWALGKVGDDNIATLRRLVKDQDNDPQVRLNAINSIGQHDAAKAQAAVTDLFKCCSELGGKSGEGGKPRRSPQESEVLRATLMALVKLVRSEDKDSATPLLNVLKDTDLEVRRNAALALGNIGGATGKDAVPILREMLRGGEPEEKRQAAAAIKNIGVHAADAVDDLRAATRDKDLLVRRYATVALGGLEKHAEKAVPELVALVTNKDEQWELRVDAAVALSRIGPGPAARAAVPDLLRVVESDQNPMRVRERAMWALRVHGNKMADFPELFPAMAKLMKDAREPEAKMLRYDCAYLLGVFKGPDAPRETIDVLYEFLKDDKIQIYGGTSGTVTASGVEKKGGNAEVKEKHIGDGRKMAVQALSNMAITKAGRDRILQDRPDIPQMLRTLSQNTPFEDLRKDITGLLKRLD